MSIGQVETRSSRCSTVAEKSELAKAALLAERGLTALDSQQTEVWMPMAGKSRGTTLGYDSPPERLPKKFFEPKPDCEARGCSRVRWDWPESNKYCWAHKTRAEKGEEGSVFIRPIKGEEAWPSKCGIRGCPHKPTYKDPACCTYHYHCGEKGLTVAQMEEQIRISLP